MLVQRISVELLVIAVVGLLLGLLGPFGTYAMPLALRLAYWIGFILIGYAIFRPVTRAAEWLTDITAIPLWVAIIMAAAIAALPLALLIGFAINGMRFERPMLSSGFPVLYMQCTGIGVAIFGLMRLVFPRQEIDQKHRDATANQQAAADPATTSHIQITSLHNRLPAGFPDILALSIEDHYVRAHSFSGSEMLLMRLSDAITEMDGVEGMQVHRGWWVAKAAITGSRRRERNLKLLLSNSMEIPVSRSFAAKLKQTGWI